MGGRQYGVLRRVVVEPGKRGRRRAMTQAAVAGDAHMQRGNCRQSRRGIVVGRGGVALETAEVGWIWHVPARQRRADPIGGLVAQGAVTAGHARITAVQVICGAQLQWRSGSDIKALTSVMAGIAGR